MLGRLSVLLYSLIAIHFFSSNRVRAPEKAPKSKLILDWTGIWNYRLEWFWNHGLRGCPEFRQKCHLSTDRKQFREASAIIFRADSPEFNYGFMPPLRWDHQRYIMYLQECPFNRDYNLRSIPDHFFNCTFTYRSDSDIPMPYGQTVPAYDKNKLPDYGDLKLVFRSKAKMVAWWVSNCETESNREEYGKELQKYIPVDIFGKCGTFRCKTYGRECDEILARDYKFYLAFENAVCNEWVTEKFFNRIRFPIIPIVLRGSDYRKVYPDGHQVAPPNSYIAADDFESPEKLGKYLKWVAANETEYLKYFEWRKNFTVDVLEDLGPNYGFCKLCQMLHDDWPAKSYSRRELVDWWYGGEAQDVCVNNFGLRLMAKY